MNKNNEIFLETYGYNTGLSIDPIEKKPLYHFYPSSKVLSFGTFGCNMGCLFCQNYHMSKSRFPVTMCEKISPEKIVTSAKLNDCKSVAFTYNEPVVFFEYAIDTAKLCREQGIKTVAVTSGNINLEPAREFYSYMDAANIDLKGYSEEFYKKNCASHLQPILDVIKYVANETNCHLELTTLIIEGENDNCIKEECEWIIDNIGDSVPIHFSAFYPRYKFNNRKPTSFETINIAYNIAKAVGLKYVYAGNVLNIETSTTYCKNCGKVLIKRDGYKVLENNLADGKCPECNTVCDGFF
jgi:pyruvate formate lyase activating enzyme